MKNSGPVRGLESTRQLVTDLGHPHQRQGTLVADHFGEGRCLHQLHHDEHAALILDHVVQGDHAGVIEPGRCPRLAQHPRLG
jgi:hypothetical protein